MAVNKALLSEEVFGSLYEDNVRRAITMRSICPYTASHGHDHRVALSDFNVSFRSSPCTSVSLNRACRLGLASKKLCRAWVVPRAFRKGSICHSILKGKVEHMSVTVDVGTKREALFHSCLESLVYTFHISRPIECFTNNVLEV